MIRLRIYQYANIHDHPSGDIHWRNVLVLMTSYNNYDLFSWHSNWSFKVQDSLWTKIKSFRFGSPENVNV